MTSTLFMGMISGTSRDGADAALVDFEGGRPDLLHALCTPYPAALKDELNALLSSHTRPAESVLQPLDRRLGQFFARVARDLMAATGVEPRDVRTLGSHGQTVWHEPEGATRVTLQLGDGALIARLTGLVVVDQFRQADLEAGGQGAPLAPLLHREIFHADAERRAVLNLGGIANLTCLYGDGRVMGFDCGPANCLLDLWAQRHLQKPFDDQGDWAATGTVSDSLLEDLLAEPWFARPAPKSTGLELFNQDWLEQRLAGHSLAPADVQATLTELTARTIADSLNAVLQAQRLLVCGGGVHNRYLLERLGANLPDPDISSTRDFGLHPDWVEAVLFAWLARERLAGRCQATGPITGAHKPVMLGRIHLPAQGGETKR